MVRGQFTVIKHFMGFLRSLKENSVRIDRYEIFIDKNRNKHRPKMGNSLSFGPSCSARSRLSCSHSISSCSFFLGFRVSVSSSDLVRSSIPEHSVCEATSFVVALTTLRTTSLLGTRPLVSTGEIEPEDLVEGDDREGEELMDEDGVLRSQLEPVWSVWAGLETLRSKDSVAVLGGDGRSLNFGEVVVGLKKQKYFCQLHFILEVFGFFMSGNSKLWLLGIYRIFHS